MKLQELDFEVRHRKGKLNVMPDALSQSFNESCVIDIPEEVEILELKHYQERFSCIIDIPEEQSDKENQENKLNWYAALVKKAQGSRRDK